MTLNRLKRFTPLLLFTAMIVFSGVIAVASGPEMGWDWQNYHFYNAYALLQGRLGIDIAPAQLQTYLNPLIDVPGYLLLRYLPPILAGFIMGAVQGLNMVLVFKIARLIFSDLPPLRNWLLALLVAVLSFFGAINVYEIGGFMGDTIISIFILAAVWYLLQYCFTADQTHRKYLLLAGLLGGLAVGLKLTALLFLPSLGLCILIFKRGRYAKVRDGLIFGGTVALGIIITSGYWMLLMQRMFQNPLFPFYNGIFKSSFVDPFNWSDTSVLPTNLISFLTKPFNTPAHNVPPFPTDFRFGILYVVLFGFLIIQGIQFILKKRELFAAKSAIITSPTALLAVFFVGAFALWEYQFGVDRYIVSLEFLTIVTTLALVYQLLRHWKTVALTLVGLFLILLPTTNRGPSERLGWGDQYFFSVPANLDLSNSQILVLGLDPLGYIFPFFPASAQIVRVESNLTQLTRRDSHDKLPTLINDTLKRPTRKFAVFDPIYYETSAATAVLSQFNLVIAFDQCQVIPSRVGPIKLCSVLPRGPHPSQQVNLDYVVNPNFHRPNTGWNGEWSISNDASDHVWLAPNIDYQVSFRMRFISSQVQKGFVFNINGQPIPLTTSPDPAADPNTPGTLSVIYSGTIPRSTIALDLNDTLLTYHVDELQSPASLKINGDLRLLGAVVYSLNIVPIRPDSATHADSTTQVTQVTVDYVDLSDVAVTPHSAAGDGWDQGWSVSKDATDHYWLQPGSDYWVRLRVKSVSQEVQKGFTFSVNGHSITMSNADLTSDPHPSTIYWGIIPSSIVALDLKDTTFTYHVDQLTSPESLKISDDPRPLGLLIYSLNITPYQTNQSTPVGPNPTVPHPVTEESVSYVGANAATHDPSQGWSGMWSVSKDATDNFWLAADSDYQIQFRADFISPQLSNGFVFRVNGQPIRLSTSSATPPTPGIIYTGVIPRSVVALNPNNTLLTYHVDELQSPVSLKINNDPRDLGLEVYNLSITQAPPTIPPSLAPTPAQQNYF